MEFFKFAIYLSIPVIASFVYNAPEYQPKLVQAFKYVRYPAENKRPPDGEEIMDRIKKARNLKKAEMAKENKLELAAEPAPTKNRRWYKLWLA